jgi:diaminopimelate epimerase
MEKLAQKLCDRHFGIGADGMIIPDVTPNNETDIAWYFYNSDGTTAQMCGNGMRCFAKYVWDKKLVKKKQFSVKTLAGVIKPEIQEDGLVRVNMGTPILEESKIPFKGEKTIKIKDRTFEITPVSMGNPHCVIFTDDDPMDLAQNYGPDIEKHSYFPEKTNTEFVKIKSCNEIDMRVYERGCGITLACGTGACASVVACVLNNLTEQKVKVNLLGGAVNVEWQGTCENPKGDIFLIGPANYSFTADYML